MGSLQVFCFLILWKCDILKGMAVNELSHKGMTSPLNECSHCIEKKKAFFF